MGGAALHMNTQFRLNLHSSTGSKFSVNRRIGLARSVLKSASIFSHIISLLSGVGASHKDVLTVAFSFFDCSLWQSAELYPPTEIGGCGKSKISERLLKDARAVELNKAFPAFKAGTLRPWHATKVQSGCL
jgi:hypothetical protein